MNALPLTGLSRGVPPPAVMRVLGRYSRTELAGFIAIAIDLLDMADGDPDAEELDLEDSFTLSSMALGATSGPGCEITDPSGQCDEDGINTQCGAELYAHGLSLDGPGCPIAEGVI